MINRVVLVGRLTRDPELKLLKENMMTKFTLAVEDRLSKTKKTDFINCIAWGGTAKAIADYQSKGDMLGVTGRITTGSYENKEGQKVYTTEVLVEEVDFIGGRKQDNSNVEPSVKSGTTDTEQFDRHVEIPTKPSPTYSESKKATYQQQPQQNLFNQQSKTNAMDLKDDDLPF
jgi:single-strand DNA-binding protein